MKSVSEWFSELGLAETVEESQHLILDYLSQKPELDEAFYVANLTVIVEKYRLWQQELPGIDLFYAVKANDDPLVLRVLVGLGSNFDCASKGELEAILGLGVPPDRIMFSNPYKLPSHLHYAVTSGVRWMVCDSPDEMDKIKDACPDAKLVIRLHPRNENTAYIKMSSKFGCNASEARNLMQKALTLGLNINGLSFYAGHCTESPAPYADAIALARDIYDEALAMGHNVTLIDLGGGFQGVMEKRPLFLQICSTIRESISKHFPKETGLQIVGEPGQFMGVAAFDVYAVVVGVRTRTLPNSNDTVQSVYVSGGHFGCIPNYTFKYNKTEIQLVTKKGQIVDPLSTPIKSIFWGPSCDPMDRLTEVDLTFPVKRGDWLRFNNMGAYSRSIASCYNGFPLASTKYVADESTRKLLKVEQI